MNIHLPSPRVSGLILPKDAQRRGGGRFSQAAKDQADCECLRAWRTLGLEIFTRAAIEVILSVDFGARGFGGRHAPTMSPRQLKEVIQVAHTIVGSVASLGALVGGGILR
jgi:hypothetical protein